MVCNRCRGAVKTIAENVGLNPVRIQLGELEIEEETLSPEVIKQLNNSLTKLGFERIDDKKSQMIEKIKNTVINYIYYSDGDFKISWSALITDKLNYEYNYISNLFSSFEGITLEQYIIPQKVEKVKELLSYEELSLNDIAFKLGYNSTAYLNTQFKKVTGMTPGQFRKLTKKTRNSLDKL